jgi:hypothetical protein
MYKLLIYRLLVFAISFFILLKTAGYFDVCAINDQSRDLNSIECSQKIDSIDLLFLGSSYTYSALNPIYFDSIGFRSYNLGISGTGVYFTELILNDFFNSKKYKPKYIVIDISPFSFCDKSDDFLSYPLHRYLDRPYTHEELMLKYPVNLSNYFQFLAKSSRKGLSSFFSKHDKINDSTCICRGFYSDFSMINAATIKEDSVKFKFLKEAIYDENKLHTLLNLASIYQKNGCKIFWYLPPTQNLQSFFSVKYCIDYDNAIKKIRQSQFMEEIVMDDVHLDDSDFRNTDHLNSQGAIKFSRAMSQILKVKLGKI